MLSSHTLGVMEVNRVDNLCQQYLNWTEGRLQRYLIARDLEPQVRMSIILALLSHRVPFYGKTTASLESPESLARLVVRACANLSDREKRMTVEVLCSIAQKYSAAGLVLDSEPMLLLVRTCAEICTGFQTCGMELTAALHALQLIVRKPITLEAARQLSRIDSHEGEALLANRKLEEAAQFYADNLAGLKLIVDGCHPKLLQGMANLADIQFALKQWAAASAIYAQLVDEESWPSSSKVLLLSRLARTYEHQEQFEEAEKWYLRAIQQGEGNEIMPEVLEKYASMLRHVGRRVEAKTFEQLARKQRLK